MELAAVNRAKQLEAPAGLKYVIEQVYEEAALSTDYETVKLKDTRVTEEGIWEFGSGRGRLSLHSLGQLCGYLKLPGGGTVPARYLAKCPDALAAQNLNGWIEKKIGSETAFVRCWEDGGDSPSTVRAILSSKYAAADHADVLETLEELIQFRPMSLQGWSLDDEQMVLRLSLDRDCPASLDDPVRAGILIRNSEVGLGCISIHAFVTRLVCSNGMVVNLADLGGVKRRHVGRAVSSLRLLIQDGLIRVLKEAEEAARRFVGLKEVLAPKPLEPFVERFVRESDLPAPVGKQAVELMAEETLYGLVNAFTQAAQSFAVTDRLRIETAASRLLQGNTARSLSRGARSVGGRVAEPLAASTDESDDAPESEPDDPFEETSGETNAELVAA
jgi:hypothetical protein